MADFLLPLKYSLFPGKEEISVTSQPGHTGGATRELVALWLPAEKSRLFYRRGFVFTWVNQSASGQHFNYLFRPTLYMPVTHQ